MRGLRDINWLIKANTRPSTIRPLFVEFSLLDNGDIMCAWSEFERNQDLTAKSSAYYQGT